MSKKNIYKLVKEKTISKPDKRVGYVRDFGTVTYISSEMKRREFGAHLTSIDIFRKFILPRIKDILYKYTWIDLFGGRRQSYFADIRNITKK